jgi:hypothetical protein
LQKDAAPKRKRESVSAGSFARIAKFFKREDREKPSESPVRHTFRNSMF